ncbi:MAG TPA: GNAT family N-acetyltransferase [Solirubrobacteraceae bacterium]
MLSTSERLTIRRGGPADASWLLSLFDEAVAWMVARGQPEQWGSEPWSQNPRSVTRVHGLAAAGGLRVAELDGVAVGALVVGHHPVHVPAVDRPELYINLLLTSRPRASGPLGIQPRPIGPRSSHPAAGRQLGSRLVQVAVDEARAGGAQLLRVDCWAGAPPLVAWYQRQGFVPSGTFEVNGWRGQVFTMVLSAAAA